MRIAVSTTDGKTICGHLGKCKSFIVYNAEGAEVLEKNLLDIGGLCPGHGADHGAHNVSPFAGCHAVITQGMGQGMMDGLKQANVLPVITDLSDPDVAVAKFLAGQLEGSMASTCSCDKH